MQIAYFSSTIGWLEIVEENELIVEVKFIDADSFSETSKASALLLPPEAALQVGPEHPVPRFILVCYSAATSSLFHSCCEIDGLILQGQAACSHRVQSPTKLVEPDRGGVHGSWTWHVP